MKKAHTYLFQFIVLTGVYYGLQLLFDWGSEYHWPKFDDWECLVWIYHDVAQHLF